MRVQFSDYIWWFLTNCFVCYAACDFLLSTLGRHKGRGLAAWVALDGVMTLLVTHFQLSGGFLLWLVVFVLYARFILKIRGSDLLAPVAVIFTLYTFIDGFSAVMMAWICAHFRSLFWGRLAQMLVSVLLDTLFFAALRKIRREYSPSLRKSGSSCLYTLLLPCALFVAAIRFDLRLDSPAFAKYLTAFRSDASFAAIFTIAAALGLFFLTLSIFNKMTVQERAAALLKSKQLQIEETAKKTASLRHDIDNHLLVLHGLLSEKRYADAERYAGKLHRTRECLSIPISTGSAALDVLLREKLNFAAQSGIKTNCEVRIPPNLQVEELDLCALFSNILDNAIRASAETEPEARKLSIATKSRAGFLVIECVNATENSQPIKEGIGLYNVRHIAEKHHGAVEMEITDGKFRISVLLSRHSRSGNDRS